MNEPAPIEIHKALADDTRYRLYRYLRLSGRPVPVRELATRLSLHANTIRPHLRRLVDAGLVASETRRGPSAVGRPQTVYTVVTSNERDGRDYRLLADILATLISGTRARTGAHALAREWGDFLVTRHAPPPGARRPGPNLAGLREALAEAGFDPRFRRKGTRTVEIALRACPFRDLLEEHQELVCTVHRGLLEGMLEGSRPPLQLRSLEPLADRGSVCRVVAGT
jgi:predicted ArsR family transcriptional regulator